MTQDGETFLMSSFETYFANIDCDDQMKLWNDFCDHTSGHQNDVVYENGDDFINNEFDDAFDAVTHALNGDYQVDSAYVKKDSWDDLYSSDCVDDLVDYEDNYEFLEYAIENDNGFREDCYDDCVAEFIDGMRENDNLDATDDQLRELLEKYDLMTQTDWDWIEEEILEELDKI